MSQKHTSHVSGDLTLLPHQRALVEKFFEPNSKRVMLLKAPVGLGKGTALVALANRLLRERPASRVLFLVPRALTNQMLERLRTTGTPSLIVDRLRYREMLDAQPKQEMWPPGCVVVLSREFARQPDIRESLLRIRWSLLLVDEAHEFRGHASAVVLRQIVESADRAVLATATWPDLHAPLETPTVATDVVEWRRESIVDEAGKPLITVLGPVLHPLSFDLSPPELSLIRAVQALGHVAGSCVPPHMTTSLRRAVASSPAAVEHAARQLEERLEPGFSADLTVETEFDDEDALGPSEPRDDAACAEEIRNVTTRVLVELEAIKADAKLSVFNELLRNLTGQPESARRVCVLTSYMSTLYYLATEIKDTLSIEFTLLERILSIDDQRDALAKMEDSGGTLVATRAALRNCHVLSEMTDLVLYDAISGGRAVADLLGQFYGVGRRTRLTIHVLIPSNEPDTFTLRSLEDLREALGCVARHERA